MKHKDINQVAKSIVDRATGDGNPYIHPMFRPGEEQWAGWRPQFYEPIRKSKSLKKHQPES
jgi:hypothetical protein